MVGLLGTVGWLVYDRQNNKVSETADTSNTQATTPQEEAAESETMKQFTATSFSLDANKLPEGWTASSNTEDLVTINSGGCFIEATKENDPALSSSKQTEGVQTLLATNDKKSSKGYSITEKGSSTLTVYTNGVAKKVTSYEFLWNLPEGGNPFRYSRAYSVQDGYYVSLKRSCSSETDFPNTDAAMSALIFKQ